MGGSYSTKCREEKCIQDALIHLKEGNPLEYPGVDKNCC